MTITPGVELCVAGLVYFEVFVPGGMIPPPGEELFVENLRLGLGGALNTASVAAALGLNVVLAHPKGDGLADSAIAHKTQQLGIPTLNWASPPNPAISLVFSGLQDRSFVSAADFNALALCPELPHARWIHVPGLLEARHLAEPLARARAAGAKISVSGSWAPAELTALGTLTDQPWDLLILNDKEAAFGGGDPKQAPDRLRGSAPNVVVTLGPDGALGRLNGAWVSADALPVAAVDFTGAGDAFCAGLLASLLRGITGDAALRHGCQVAARLLTQAGGVVNDPAILADLKGTP